MDSAANSSGASLPSVPNAAARKPAPRPAAATPAPARGRCRLTLDQEVDVLIRARYPIIFIRTYEEERAEHLLRSIAERRNKKLLVWTVTQGIQKPEAEAARGKPGGRTNDPLTALDSILDSVEPAIFLMKDFHPYMMPTPCNRNGHIIRRLRDAAIQLRDTYKTIVVVGPLLNLAPELEKDVTILDFPLPTTREFNALLDRIVSDVKENSQLEIAIDSHDRERLFHAARGLTLREAENVFAKTLVVDGKLTADDIDMVYSEKQQIIRKSGLLEYYESDERLGHVAGLNNLKDWFKKRSIAFSDQAARFGLPSPRGVLLLGVQGCGKSLIAKAVSSFWRLPLLRFDVGRMFSSLVGSSEENVRRAIQTAESVAPAILWIDEIDKALAGSTSSAGSDGGTSSRVFGTLLTWLSEKSSPVFVIATANDISHLPPELLRKGRLDEIFFVDLPNAEERKDVFQIHLQRRGRDAARFDLDALARACEGYSGAEIEESVVSGLFDAFSQKSDLTTDILLNSLQQTVPLSRTMSEELNRLRTWAAGRARPATGTEAAAKPEARRKIELV
ncbi:AAA family ATPase [Planctomyces sp. SH-PL14]|uniref:AAA family ATPase n=1 Tax=Planctomyces sp. SH-PL14 TaxID=1632864 RepID=UPI00078BF1FB|nr:AAA family ATPase [Planctomyces sp. SH-PL14]AMV19806.1 ATP-dependent zinc metalloprotease FtsH 2 [Planctomyces sp. SH-PL14]